MHKLKVKAVIFDMDGVITNTMPFHFAAWKKIFSKEGLKVTDRQIYLREGQPGIVTIKEIFSEAGRTFNKKEARRILSQKEDHFKKIVKKRFIPGSRPFLRLLKNRGIELALVTGTARHEVRRILPKSLFDMFSVVVTGDEVKKGKPHPEPYNKAVRKLAVTPQETAVIENAPFGVDSAKRAGLKCLAIETSLSKSYLKGADFVFAGFKDLQKKMEFVNSNEKI